MVISIIAGAEIKTISNLIDSERIVRVMPNTPALVQTGAHGIYATDVVGASDRELTSQILAATGLTIWVNSEAQIDAVTAVSGSGPAYFFYLMESMIRAGKNLGLMKSCNCFNSSNSIRCSSNGNYEFKYSV